jgi:hypothetical protein
MVDRILIDKLKFHGGKLAERWAHKIHKAPELRSYGTMSDDELIAINQPVYEHLSRALERGIDRTAIGRFFVGLGKTRRDAGHPISETVLALNLCRQVAIDFVTAETELDNPVKLYQSIGISSTISEFFFLACFYMTKGFLESTYESMSKTDNIPVELLKKYFTDDFFFKKME